MTQTTLWHRNRAGTIGVISVPVKESNGWALNFYTPNGYHMRFNNYNTFWFHAYEQAYNTLLAVLAQY